MENPGTFQYIVHSGSRQINCRLVKMHKQDYENIKLWFDEFVSSYFGDDQKVNENLFLKKEHTAKVCEEMRALAEHENFDEHKTCMATAVALLHDAGRFEQFKKYGTYNDLRSVNHGCLGRQLVHQSGVLEALSDREQYIIETVIEHHGAKEIPEALDDEVKFYLELVRDADKVDIYRVVCKYMEMYRNAPENFRIEKEFPDDPYCSQPVIETVMQGRTVDYRILETMYDMILLQLGWVFDMNYDYSLKLIWDRGYIETLTSFLPRSDQNAQKAAEYIRNYVKRRFPETR